MDKSISQGSRSKKANRNIYAMFIIKGVNILTNLAYVPLLISVLNKEVYGIWLTITTIVGWLNFFDIGLGHGLRNKLTECIANDNTHEAKEYISTTYIALTCLAIIILVLSSALIPLIDWSIALNASPSMSTELKNLVLCLVGLFCLSFPLKLASSLLLAFQLPALSSLIGTLAQVISYLIIFVLVKVDVTPSLTDLGIIISAAPVFIFSLSTWSIFKFLHKEYKPSIRYYNKNKLSSTLSLGSRFFILQIITLILYQSNNIIISHILGPEYVTDFNIAYKYIGIINMFFTIIVSPFWSATTDAYTKKEYNWIRSIMKKLSKVWVLSILLGGGLILLAPLAYKLWLKGMINVDYILLSLMLIYFVINTGWVLYGNIINGIGTIKLQLYCTLATSLIYMPLAVILGHTIGLYGIIITMILTMLPNLIWGPIQINKLLSGKAAGIWSK